MLSGTGRHRRPRQTATKRLIATATVTGVGATLPVIAAGAASAHTVTAAPAAVHAVVPAAAPAVAPATVPQAPAQQAYTVVSGDWLSKIAASHNVQCGWQKLYELNRGTLTKGPDLIFPGQRIILSDTTAAAPAPAKPTTPAAPATPAAPTPTKPTQQGQQGWQGWQNQHQADKPATKPTQQAPKTSPMAYTGGSLQALAASIVPADQFAAFSQIISHESSWNVHATNPSSGAYGLAQALPGSKMASAGSDWRDNPATQLKWALDYMNSRYGSPNAAWAFWQTHHWY